MKKEHERSDANQLNAGQDNVRSLSTGQHFWKSKSRSLSLWSDFLGRTPQKSRRHFAKLLDVLHYIRSSLGLHWPPCVQMGRELHLVKTSNDQTLASSVFIYSLHRSRTDNWEARAICTSHDLIIGRDKSKCQWVVDDPYLSAKHLRIYTIVYDNEDDGQPESLVYAEDISRHGTFWNNSLIGKGNGGFLLSHGDRLRLSVKTTFRFHSPNSEHVGACFDIVQEAEMTRFRNDYVVTDRLLGAGTFGRVFMAIEQRSRVQVACKVVDLRKFTHTVSKHLHCLKKPSRASNVNQAEQIQRIKSWARQQRKNTPLEERLEVCFREVDILSRLNHPNIIGLDKVFVTDHTIYIFQDLIAAGDLFSYIEFKNGKLLEVEVAVIIRQILIALQYLHKHNIVHRDLKPENIMMTSLSAGCRVVLTDFGAAKRLTQNQRMKSIVGTREYAAPEVRLNRTKSDGVNMGYTKAVDMWSLGAVAAVLLTGGSAFVDPSTGTYSPTLARTCYLGYLESSKEWTRISARPKAFVKSLLVLDDKKRLTADGGLRHPWFSNKVHKPDFEELYQRTIKHWYPRVAKSPVVEFTGSSIIKYLQPCKNLTENSMTDMRKRARQANKPIDPPYKPFPRNMHAKLWPSRGLSGRSIPDSVRFAIANNWSRTPQNFVSTFHTLSESVRVLSDNNTTSLNAMKTCVNRGMITSALKRNIEGAASSSQELAPQLMTEICSPTSARRKSKEEDDIENVKSSMGEKEELDETNVQQPSGFVHGSNLASTAPLTNLQTSGLRRKFSSIDQLNRAKKHWRHDLFDVMKGVDSASHTNDNSSACASTKRVKRTN